LAKIFSSNESKDNQKRGAGGEKEKALNST
jgi:hypothetical protein